MIRSVCRRMLLTITLLLGAAPVLWARPAWEKPLPSQTPHTRASEIALIEGTPARGFVKLQPVLATAPTMEAALQELRRQAWRVRADAVIEFTFESRQGHMGGGTLDAPADGQQHGKGTAYGSTTQEVVAKGWAVQWQEETRDEG